MNKKLIATLGLGLLSACVAIGVGTQNRFLNTSLAQAIKADALESKIESPVSLVKQNESFLETEELNQTVKENNLSAEPKKVEVNVEGHEGFHKLSDILYLTYTVNSEMEIKDYYYQNTGLEILSEQFTGDALEFACKFKRTLPSLHVTFVMENEEEFSSFIEGIQADDYIMFKEDGIEPQIPQVASSNSEKVHITGKVTWTDLWGNVHPVILQNIEIWDEETVWDSKIGETLSDIHGNFNIYVDNDFSFFEGGNDFYIKVLTQSRSSIT